MIRRIIKLAIILCMSTWFTVPVWALDKGPIIANNILGGASAGAAVGLSAGLLSYGMDHHANPEVILHGMVYGFLGGAVLGTGIGVYEISTGRDDTGFTVSNYLLGGTGIGALIGAVVAIIPFTKDEQWENFTIGVGLGGVIGASLGLTFAVIDISGRPSGGGGELLSGEMGLTPQVYVPLSVPGNERESECMLSCRLVRVTF